MCENACTHIWYLTLHCIHPSCRRPLGDTCVILTCKMELIGGGECQGECQSGVFGHLRPGEQDPVPAGAKTPKPHSDILELKRTFER